METLARENKKHFKDSGDILFSRTIDDLLFHDFFNSFDATIHENQDSYRLEIAVPGVTRKDITIHIEGSMLWVSAKKKTKNTRWKAREISEKNFQRSFTLPKHADVTNIKAKCRNGMLRIKIGKSKGMHRMIKIAGKQTDAATVDSVTLWWKRLMNKASQTFAKK